MTATPDTRVESLREWIALDPRADWESGVVDEFLAAEAALASLAADLAKAQAGCNAYQGTAAVWRALYEQTNAELAATRQALETAVDCKGWGEGTVTERGGYPAICTKCEEIARAVLAGEDTT